MSTHSKTYLVLSQYRNNSPYDNSLGGRYHFPKKYYNLLTLPEIEFIYYEPHSQGEGAYFGYGEVGRIERDPEDSGKYYADILGFREFKESVHRLKPDGLPWEPNLFSMAQCAVRQIELSSFEEICEAGGIELASLGLEVENPESDDNISEPFDPKQIKVDREPMSVFQVLRKIELGEITLNPDFQRNFVWDLVRRSRLIESALLRLPLPAFYFDGVDANLWTVVDGLQRLSTLRDFITKKNFRLQGLEYLRKVAEGKTFDELPRGMQRDLEETQMTLFIIRPDTPPDVKFTIFYRINTGGLVLTAQEIRHALFQGNSTALLQRLAATDEFLRATDWGVSDTRMDARECVLRYLSFHLHPYDEYGKSDLNGYLSNTMKEINGMTDSEISSLEDRFLDAMTRIHQLLGRNAFRKFNPYTGRRGPVNKALLESWANALQEYPIGTLIERRDKLEKILGNAFQSDPDYSRALSSGTGSRASVIKRFERAHQIIQESLE
jgi:hypothetical protein